MNNINNYILIIKAYILADDWLNAQKLWQKNYLKSKSERVVYVKEDEHILLELISFSNLADLNKWNEERHNFEKNAHKFMRSDWHVTVVEYKEDLKGTIRPLPSSNFIELRHIEVPLNVYDEYKAWRKKTIYKNLKPKKEIEVFSYYHSILGDKPGVYFIVGFSSDVQSYTSVYKTKEYLNILEQAGKKYIAGGLSGLSTEIYKNLSKED